MVTIAASKVICLRELVLGTVIMAPAPVGPRVGAVLDDFTFGNSEHALSALNSRGIIWVYEMRKSSCNSKNFDFLGRIYLTVDTRVFTLL